MLRNIRGYITWYNFEYFLIFRSSCLGVSRCSFEIFDFIFSSRFPGGGSSTTMRHSASCAIKNNADRNVTITPIERILD